MQFEMSSVRNWVHVVEVGLERRFGREIQVEFRGVVDQLTRGSLRDGTDTAHQVNHPATTSMTKVNHPA